MKLSNLADKSGYSKEFQQFCDAIFLDGHGKNVVARFMTGGFPEKDMIQTVLSYQGVVFGYDYLLPGEEISPEDERITEEGKAEYLAHCDPDGRFRYEDFPPIKKSKPLDPATPKLFG